MFAPELPGLDRDEIRRWYNGYNWLGELVPQGRALQQLQDRGYADKYRARGEPIHLIGVEFSKADRNIVGFEVETLAAA